MNSSSKNRRNSCAADEVCLDPTNETQEQTLATAGLVRDNAVTGNLESWYGMCVAGGSGHIGNG